MHVDVQKHSNSLMQAHNKSQAQPRRIRITLQCILHTILGVQSIICQQAQFKEKAIELKLNISEYFLDSGGPSFKHSVSGFYIQNTNESNAHADA